MTRMLYLKAEGHFGTDRFMGRLSPISGHHTLFYPSKDKPDMRVEVHPNEYPSPDHIESIYHAEVSDELSDALSTGVTKYELPKPLADEISDLFNQINDWTNEVLRYIKYGLNFVELSESPFRPYANREFWSIDGLAWNHCTPEGRVILQGGSVRESSSEMAVPLDDKTAPQIQQYIDDNYSPFVSLTYLHRAINEGHPRYKWIYATIAAELAIKEFLVEYTSKDGCAELEPLLLELPSPPLRKLYGSILESYLGERSPCVGKIDKGAERRNRLLHRPKGKGGEQEKVSEQEARQYARQIELALFHLLHQLYQNDWIIERLFANIKQIVGADCG
jgi:hypothetical protein